LRSQESGVVSEEAQRLGAALGRAAAAVDGRLEAVLEAAVQAGAPARLAQAMQHGVLAGGKRFRPFLVIETAALVAAGGQPPDRPGRLVLDAAAALELVHAYSLVHDDLPAMDNDELRRGRPTVWKAYDEWTAILAGDGLLTLAFEVLAGTAAMPATPEMAPGEAQMRLALAGELAAAAGPAGMVGGQGLDLEAEKLGLPASPDAAHVSRLQAMKTGRLITFACRAGARIGGGTVGQIAAAGRYGDALGRAFQIADDLLDVSGDAAVVGKAVGKDLALGKATLVAVAGEAAARAALDAAVAEALAALDGLGEPAARATLRAAALGQARRDR
jgi:farnesyl diphosphate synthase